MEKRKQLQLIPPNSQFFHSPATADLFSVLNVHVKDNHKVMQWIISNFMDICIDIKLGMADWGYARAYEEFFRQNIWYSCPFIEEINLKVDFITSVGINNFSELVYSAIKEDYYVYADLNTYYIPNYCSKRNWQHNILLYGYDLSKEVFQVADYFRNRKYTLEECSIKDINLAWDNMCNLDGNGSERFRTINIFRYKDCPNYNLNLLNLKNSLKDYINSENLLAKYGYAYFAYEYRDSGELYYGISYYDALLKIVENGQWFSPKLLHFLVVHKSIMKLRIEVLVKLKILGDSMLETKAENLLKQTIILRNLLLKISQKKNSEFINNLEDQIALKIRIKELKELDYNFTNMLLEQLEYGMVE